MVDVLFGPEVRQILESNDPGLMQTFCETLHPATVAAALEGEFDVDEVWRFLSNTNIRNQAAIFEYFPIEQQVRMAVGTGRPHMARLIEQMSADDRADLLRRLEPRVAEAIIRLVDEANRRDIAALAKFPEGTAGALMTTEYAWLPENITVSDALDRLRLQAPDTETIYYVFVLDDQRRLKGVVSLRDLIMAPRHSVIRDIMEKDVVRVRVTDDREKVAREIAKFDLIAMPVVDENDRLVGIVTHDDVIDVVVKEATEDAHRMGAVSPLEEDYLHAPFFVIWRNRAFWLSLLFGAELLTFTALAHFEEAIAQMVVLALFVPLCISTGGNSGSQAATLITRAIALGQIDVKKWFWVLRHELLVGVALGLTLGAIGFARGFLTPDDIRNQTQEREEAFQIVLAKGENLERLEDGSVWVPEGSKQLLPQLVNKRMHVILPAGTTYHMADGTVAFPGGCKVHLEAVRRVALGGVIACAVMLICLWGTMVGSMLPLIFKSIGVDPGIASSPFVATFVDVTGIMIYFSIATLWLF